MMPSSYAVLVRAHQATAVCDFTDRGVTMDTLADFECYMMGVDESRVAMLFLFAYGSGTWG